MAITYICGRKTVDTFSIQLQSREFVGECCDTSGDFDAACRIFVNEMEHYFGQIKKGCSLCADFGESHQQGKI